MVSALRQIIMAVATDVFVKGMIVNNLLRASSASRFLPKAHRYLLSAIVGQMMRNHRKVKVNCAP
jgi:hypothetical protein